MLRMLEGSVSELVLFRETTTGVAFSARGGPKQSGDLHKYYAVGAWWLASSDAVCAHLDGTHSG